MALEKVAYQDLVNPEMQPMVSKAGVTRVVLLLLAALLLLVGAWVLMEYTYPWITWMQKIGHDVVGPMFGLIGIIIIAFLVIVTLINVRRIKTSLIGYDGWLWQSEYGRVHLDADPPRFRREPDGLLMELTENGWDRSHKVLSDNAQGKDVVSVGPIVPYSVGLLRRWYAWRNPKRYQMQYFNPRFTHVIQVSTRDGMMFRIEENGQQKPVIEGLPDLIMSVLMRNMHQSDTQKMLREPDRMEAWYVVMTEAVRALHDVLKDRNRVPSGKVSAGDIRRYLAEVDRVLKAENKGWQGVTPDASTGPSMSFFEAQLDELFPRPPGKLEVTVSIPGDRAEERV